jgi:hypothetical protein
MSFLTALVLLAAPALHDEIAAGVGVLGNSFQVVGARLGDTQLAPGVFARKQLSFFTVEGSLLAAIPFDKQTVGFALLGLARVGYAGEHFFIQGGAALQWANGAKPAVEILPTLKAGFLTEKVGVTFGLFDYYGLLPAHLTLNFNKNNSSFLLGYAAPLGLTVGFKTQLTSKIQISMTAFAYKLAQAEFGFLMLQGHFGDAS